MEDAQIAVFRSLLQERREQLLAREQAGAESADTVELDQSRVGRVSRMDALQGQAMSLAAHRRRRLELAGIASALARMAQGDYGCCTQCGEAIAVQRLQVDPTAALCIACAEAREKQ